MRDEKQVALAMADRRVLALDPGRRTGGAWHRLIAMLVSGSLERIPDHGDRDLPIAPFAALQWFRCNEYRRDAILKKGLHVGSPTSCVEGLC